MPVIDLNGNRVSYSVRTSKRAKRISVRYSLSGGLEVVYPPGRRQHDPAELLHERTDWILAAIDKFSVAQSQLPQRHYREGESFMFRGACYKLKLEKDPSRKRITVQPHDGFLAFQCPDSATIDEPETVRGAVESFYREEAKKYLPPRVRQLAEAHGFEYEKVRIKNQKTRWGSCSAKRNINLNLRLMMTPDAAIDYVIIHELCHLRELNHNPAFWALVESYCAEFRHWKAWFKEYGPRLIL